MKGGNANLGERSQFYYFVLNRTWISREFMTTVLKHKEEILTKMDDKTRVLRTIA
jgi:hypothetical protein